VTGIQRRSERSGWKIDCLNSGKSPFEGDEPGLAELIERVACEKKSFRVTDDYSVCRDADAILIDVQTPYHVPHYESLREVSAQAGRYLQPGTLVIVESTVAPGTTQNVVQPILERESGLKASPTSNLQSPIPASTSPSPTNASCPASSWNTSPTFPAWWAAWTRRAPAGRWRCTATSSRPS
jgi:hypothetical protein